MSARQVSMCEVRELQARLPRWLGPSLQWSARFFVHGPRWIPWFVRRAPLSFCCAFLVLYVRWWL